jgi:heme/copper-type cytochrome/quinol oxidase subunit 2
MVMSTTNIVLIVLAVAFLLLYLFRRRSRLGSDDE